MDRSKIQKRVAIGGALIVLIVLVIAVVSYALSGPKQELAQDVPLPPVVEEPLTKTDLAQVKTVFGLFQTLPVSADSPNPDTQFPAILLLNQDGSTQASQPWTVPFESTSWKQTSVFQIRSLTMRVGYATIGTNRDRTFVVKANQPFIFEDVPEQMYLIDGNGQTWAITTARAEALRKSLTK